MILNKNLLNLSILFSSIITIGLCLYFASHGNLFLLIFCAFIFMHVNNTIFSMMHESVHNVASNNKTLNLFIGILSSAFFPTSLTSQRAAHLGHHLRNRTDAELFDYATEEQNIVFKNIWLYLGNLLGFYYITVVISNLLILLFPFLFKSKYFVDILSEKLGFSEFVRDIAKQNVYKVWSELFLSFTILFSFFYLLDLKIIPTLICYYAFALHWSSLQYVDHAYSARDTKSGAWNLKVLTPFRYVALNYHYHRAHHLHPNIPWYDLPKYTDNLPDPTFWQIYFLLWQGIKKAPPFGSTFDYYNIVFKKK